MKVFWTVPILALTVACNPAGLSDNLPDTTIVDAAADCPVIESSEWSAWIDAEPSATGANPQLHIRGNVVLPTPGYSAEWTAGPSDRAMPPGQRFTLSFSPPDGMVTQVITPMNVAYQGDAAYPEYRVIYIICGDEQLAEITEIPTAL